MNRVFMRFLIIFVCLFSNYAWADGVPLRDVSGTLMVGGGILMKIMWAASIIVGIALIAAAFTQFQIHRRNPKLVPLTTPVLYLILGIAAIVIPFVESATGFIEGKSAKAPVAQKTKVVNPNDIDAPY